MCRPKGYGFCTFWFEVGLVFEGTTGVYERIYRFNSKCVRKKEKYANSKWILKNIVFVAGIPSIPRAKKLKNEFLRPC